VGPAAPARIRELIAGNPDWSRRRLSQSLAEEWDWRNARGQLKDMATRTLLLKLEARGLIQLPPRWQTPSNRMTGRSLPRQNWDSTSVECKFPDLGPLTVREVSTDAAARVRFTAALAEFHYLGYRGTVGENLQYTVTDRHGRWLACLVFGAAAWKCRARDEFIGWTAGRREHRLHLITNNTRFLILPFVRVPHLASWILGRVMRRLSRDWEQKYGHSIALVETFGVTASAGTSGCQLGPARETRSQSAGCHSTRVPVKDVYVYPPARLPEPSS
jgi:hypothetical protein